MTIQDVKKMVFLRKMCVLMALMCVAPTLGQGVLDLAGGANPQRSLGAGTGTGSQGSIQNYLYMEQMKRLNRQLQIRSAVVEKLNPSLRGIPEPGVGLMGANIEGSNTRDLDVNSVPVEVPPSRIEMLMSDGLPKDPNEVIEQFGYEIFLTPLLTVDPGINAPVNDDYVIGAGDHFSLTMWGRQTDQFSVVVDRNGKIALPEVGALAVSGMTFKTMQEYLTSELKKKYLDVTLHVSMDQMRLITVYVVGEAVIPGPQVLTSMSTLVNALFMCAGANKDGSLRQVKLIRGGKEIQTADLYDYLLGGDTSRDQRLQDGDTIHIPIIGPVVSVSGYVKRPAIYEIRKGDTLLDVLKMAGDVTHKGRLEKVQVQRVENHKKLIVVDYDISKMSEVDVENALNTEMWDGDKVEIFPVSGRERNVVNLAGHVYFPGKYEFKPGMTLRDLLSSRDVIKPQVNLNFAQIRRLEGDDLNPSTIPLDLGKFLEGGADENLVLQEYDTVTLYKWDERDKVSVTSSGMVYEPSEFRLVPGMRVKDLVNVSGGLQKNAYFKNAEITRRAITQEGMETEKIEINLGKAMADDPGHNILLQDYDHLIVRSIPELNIGMTVTMEGQIRFPGTYPIRTGERISSVIERAGGFTSDAYLKGAILGRESAKEVQEKSRDDLIRQVEMYEDAGVGSAIAGSMGMEDEINSATANRKDDYIAILKSVEIDGRVVIRLSDQPEFKASKKDLILEDGDVVDIPRTPGIVSVVGDVFNPTSIAYEKGKPVKYYLACVGGITKAAEKKQISILKADGSVISNAQSRSGRVAWDNDNRQWLFGGFMSLPLDPGDTIVVPRDTERVPWMSITKDLTQIIFQIAVTAGVMAAL